MRHPVIAAALVCLPLGLAALCPPASAQSYAPNGPGFAQGWAPANKHGFATARPLASNVWFTLGASGPTEMHYPRADIPSVRDLQLVVSDGAGFAEREADATTTVTSLANAGGLLYRQTSTAKSGRYRIVKTYATDPVRPTLLVNIVFTSLDGHPYRVYALLNPAPNNDLSHASASTTGRAMLASGGGVATAFLAEPKFAAVETGFLGTSDGWQDLKAHKALTWTYDAASNGDVVQTGETTLDGVGQTGVTLAIGFGATTAAALGSAQHSLAAGYAATSAAYVSGWTGYLSRLKQPPTYLTAPQRALYNLSLQVLAAHEDKTYRGAYIASPTAPWGFGTYAPSDAYHLVWARDLYQIATALLAAGDRAGATRAMQYLFNTQQKPDGSFPQNSRVDGSPVWGGLQMDEVGFPLILAWQLGATDVNFYWDHVKRAADFIAYNGPYTQTERWENQSGYSPATIAAEIAGLICAADIASKNNDPNSAAWYRSTADRWQRSVQGWTATGNGPLSSSAYYLRLTKDQQPNSGTTYNLGDSAPDNVDQRGIVDPSFLDLVRLGVKPPSDPTIRNSLAVVDARLAQGTPNGTFWYRYNFDGYGEQANGAMWGSGFAAGSQATRGRLWPIFAGERGEYEIANNQPDLAATRLAAMAATANDGMLLPEQVWDHQAPAGQPGFAPGAPTTSATPLAWSHAQYVRLVWSLFARRPVEQPSIVACRYLGGC